MRFDIIRCRCLADEDVYFLPQRPNCTVGTLNDQLLYSIGRTYDANKYDGSIADGYTVRNQRILKENWSYEDLLDVLDQVDSHDVAVRPDKDGNPLRGLYIVSKIGQINYH